MDLIDDVKKLNSLLNMLSHTATSHAVLFQVPCGTATQTHMDKYTNFVYHLAGRQVDLPPLHVFSSGG